MKIYIVEDNSFYAELLSIVLLNKNHNVEIFNSAEDCIEALEDLVPDVVVLDFYLRDGADGFAVLDRLNKIKNNEVRVVMLTSSNSIEIKKMAKRKGADYFLKKSNDAGHELERIIKEIKVS